MATLQVQIYDLGDRGIQLHFKGSMPDECRALSRIFDHMQRGFRLPVTVTGATEYKRGDCSELTLVVSSR